jgi:hypothetical protein
VIASPERGSKVISLIVKSVNTKSNVIPLNRELPLSHAPKGADKHKIVCRANKCETICKPGRRVFTSSIDDPFDANNYLCTKHYHQSRVAEALANKGGKVCTQCSATSTRDWLRKDGKWMCLKCYIKASLARYQQQATDENAKCSYKDCTSSPLLSAKWTLYFGKWFCERHRNVVIKKESEQKMRKEAKAIDDVCSRSGCGSLTPDDPVPWTHEKDGDRFTCSHAGL